jgi:hypothetical protein
MINPTTKCRSHKSTASAHTEHRLPSTHLYVRFDFGLQSSQKLRQLLSISLQTTAVASPVLSSCFLFLDFNLSFVLLALILTSRSQLPFLTRDVFDDATPSSNYLSSILRKRSYEKKGCDSIYSIAGASIPVLQSSRCVCEVMAPTNSAER